MVRSRIVIVGGGIAGLSAAWELSQSLPRARITVLDAGDRPGGKLRREPIAGALIDVGAESMLARRPEATRLVAELGADELLIHPTTTSASIWSRGALHPMPPGTLMGVPGRPEAARGLLDDAEVARAQDEKPWRTGQLTEDVSIGDYVATRLGDAVVDRLVEPLLGGVYAGHARSLSLQACVPALFEAAKAGDSITALARSTGEAALGNRSPVFAGLAGGLGLLPERLVEALRGRGVQIRSSAIVRELQRTRDGWAVVIGPRPTPERVDADAVVLAVPAAPAARLLGPVSRAAAAELAAIEYASMAIVTLALDGSHLELPGSGFLVPPVDGRAIKASTFTSAKWAWAAEASHGVAFVRASVGRAGETRDLHHTDAELVSVAVAELSEALGRRPPRLVDWHVQRWGGGLPQYAVGHVDRVARIRTAVASEPGLELAGAAYEGVGIPACIGTGRAAAQAVATHLRSRAERGGE